MHRRDQSMHQPVENTTYCLDRPTPRQMGNLSLWERILGLIEQDLNERRNRKLFVEVPGEPGSRQKEIGDSAAERQGLHPALREHVAERFLDRHLAEQGYVDLVDKRRTYTKKLEDLTHEDLPALVEADRWRVEEEQEKERERVEFIQEARADLEQLLVVELAGISEAGKKVRR